MNMKFLRKLPIPQQIKKRYPVSEQDAAVKAAVERVAGCPGEFVSYCTEAGFMATLGPTVVLGPGSIREAHAVDEFVPLRDLERIESILAKLGLL